MPGCADRHKQIRDLLYETGATSSSNVTLLHVGKDGEVHSASELTREELHKYIGEGCTSKPAPTLPKEEGGSGNDNPYARKAMQRAVAAWDAKDRGHPFHDTHDFDDSEPKEPATVSVKLPHGVSRTDLEGLSAMLAMSQATAPNISE